MDTKWLCLIAGAVPVALWMAAWVTATVGMSRAIQPRPHRARALAARIARELGGHTGESRIEEGERGEWRAIARRGVLAIAARVSSTGFGDVVTLEVEGPRPWLPDGVSVSIPKSDARGIAVAPANLEREGAVRRWSVAPPGATLDPRLIEWLFSPAASGVLEIRERLVHAIYRRDDSNDDAHVADIRSLLDALATIAPV